MQFIGVLETKVKKDNVSKISKSVFSDLSFEHISATSPDG